MKDKIPLIDALPKLMIGAGVLLFVFGWMTWENLAWRSAYASIQPGTNITALESQFKALKPVPRRCEYSRGGFWEHDSYAHLVIAGPNRWKYVFYLDPNNCVVDKGKWWD